MKQIVILVHDREGFDRTGYLVQELGAIWREDGIEVRVLCDPSVEAGADLAILHVDMTVTPDAYLHAARRYPRAINSGVATIAKKHISGQRVKRGDGYPGPVIVKTNRNYGGIPERQFTGNGRRIDKYLDKLRNRLPWAWRSHLPPLAYPIFDRADQVPWAAWHHPDLIVERFLPERSGDLYCLRTWVFLGDRESNSLSLAKEPIVKSNNVIRREQVDDVPAELRQRRRELGFDYGKFDYGIVDGNVVLYDANRTPTLGQLNREDYRPRARHLAEGIRTFL